MTPTFVDPLIGKRADRYELVHVESGAVLASRLETAFDARVRRRGLMGRDALPPQAALVFAPSRAVHTLAARAPVDVVFVARDGTVVKAVRSLKPWRASAALGAHAVIAAPAGFLARSGTIPGDRMAIREAQAPRPPREILPLRSPGRTPEISAVDSVEPWDLDHVEPRQEGRMGTAAAGAPSGLRTGPPRSAAAVRTPVGPADLERVLARRTPVAWYEAVAVVRELCDAVMTSSPGDGLRVPELAEILLTPDGRVELAGAGPATPNPVAAAARVLLALLAEAESLPVQVRLLALEVVSSSPGADSMASFVSRLEYFERPGRRDHIRALVERFRGLPQSPLEALAEAPEAEAPPSPAPPPPTPWWRRRRARLGLVAASGAVILLALVSALLAPRGRPTGAAERPGPGGTVERRGPVARTVADVSERVAAIASDSIDAVARWLGVSPAARKAPAPAETVAEAPTADSQADRAGVALRRRRVRTPQTAPEPREAERPKERPAPALVDTLIYSSDDAGVVPPRLDRARLPAAPRVGTAQHDLPQVELVIAASGEVESVKLVTGPADVRAAMMLSAVKNWQFRPATRDGVPVRYRMRLRLTNQ